MPSKKLAGLILPLMMFGLAEPAESVVIFADTVIDFVDSGAGPLPGPYGGTFPGAFPVPVDLSFATDGDSTTFVSLPLGSSITLGFSGGFVFDGPGNDIFVSEVGGNDELADIFISSDFGASFTFLGQATTATVSGFDLSSIGFTDTVNAVRVVGLDLLGGSPGFDLSFVQGLEGSVVAVPLPSTAALLFPGLLGLSLTIRSRRRRQADQLRT